MLNTWEEADAAADLLSTLDELATVYGADPSTTAGGGRWTMVLKTNLRCRNLPLHIRYAPTSGQRAEEMSFRYFFWQPDYFLPEQCQIDLSGVRWQPEAGTFQALRAGSSDVLIRRCSVIRVQVASF